MKHTDELPGKAVMQLDERGLYVVKDQADEMRVAEMLLKSGAVNKSLTTPVHVIMAIQAAKSLALNPYTALRQIGFVNGALMLYGDLELAAVRRSGKLRFKEEFLYCINDGVYQKRGFENGNLHLPVAGAVCRLGRVGDDYVEEAAFSVEDAKQAGLWNKTQPWRCYPGRMLQMRARGLAIRNIFSDVTMGAASEYDLHGPDTDMVTPDVVIDAELTGTKAALKLLRNKKTESQTPSSTVPQEDTQQ